MSTHAIPDNLGNNINLIRWVSWTIALVLGIFYANNQYTEHKAKVEAEKAKVAAYTATRPPASTLRAQSRKPYRFDDFPDGTIKVSIHSGEVDFYPQGGEIEIAPLPPAKPWHDRPGIRQPRKKLPTGEYSITRVDTCATGVEIWN